MPLTATRPAEPEHAAGNGKKRNTADASGPARQAMAAREEGCLDPVASARAARLRYVSDRRPGIRREPRADGFAFFDRAGNEVTDEATLARIKSLAIPPAWTDVWICPQPNGHLQATGRDQKRRKQYRYHPRWRVVRDETKYTRMVSFARALPAIRRHVEEDLQRPGLPREKVLATVVRLLETTHIRVGNDEYARNNRHFGLTTIRNQHVKVSGSTVRFRFTGKSGIRHEVELSDPRLARIIRRCQDLPGQELFAYRDDDGNERDVTSTDVNAYLREISGEDFTAKDFRTWAGTMLAAQALHRIGTCETQTQAKRNVVQAIQECAERLGNTPAVCRKAYIHPDVIQAYLDSAPVPLPLETDPLPSGDLSPEEQAVLAFLESRLAGA